ncbi:MAG: transcriptional regulator [bacterium (Candidatus Stahlbacteria) CG23_combo_of_CG06-09_8_20_14_all_34_7]|nr:MAG: transcriptional regulator [bacterium (Candidatus Stahlbacteria) CG23_combo_of_CG06-09_8_20_14_all_34_7]
MKTKFENKQYYSIKEIGKMSNLKPYVLRYWERVFPQLQPRKHNGNRRMYTIKDLEIVKLIKHLLYEKKYTIKGANECMKNKTEVKQLIFDFNQKLNSEKMKDEIEKIINTLKGNL